MSEELRKRTTELEASNEQYQKTVEDITLENIELRRELAKHEWVSVENRLPDEFGSYLIINAVAGMQMVKTSIYHPNRKQFNIRLVSHWKPIRLPDQPKSKEHDNDN